MHSVDGPGDRRRAVAESRFALRVGGNDHPLRRIVRTAFATPALCPYIGMNVTCVAAQWQPDLASSPPKSFGLPAAQIRQLGVAESVTYLRDMPSIRLLDLTNLVMALAIEALLQRAARA